MSDLQVDVCKILEIKPHPKADRLEIAIVKGWDIITGIGNYKVGDIVVHIPPDSLVPDQWAEKWEVTKYLSWNKRNEGKGRVKVARLRGIPSYGFLVPNESDAQLGADLTEHYGITKWEPPSEKNPGGANQGKSHKHHPLFFKYTDIQNIRNYPNVFEDGELVSVSEKIHGSNGRVGLLKKQYKGIWGFLCFLWDLLTHGNYEIAVGSHNVQRNPDNPGIYGTPLEICSEEIKGLLQYLIVTRKAQGAIVYGEVYGAVQDLKYGSPEEVQFRAFDISVDGEYINNSEFILLTQQYNIPTVPVLYRGPYSKDIMNKLYTGKTTISNDHMREGIVIKPLEERYDHKCGRVVLKAINPDYLTRKGGTERH